MSSKKTDQRSAPAQTQREKFEQAARELETDNSEDRFDRVVKEIAKSPETDKDATKPN